MYVPFCAWSYRQGDYVSTVGACAEFVRGNFSIIISFADRSLTRSTI